MEGTYLCLQFIPVYQSVCIPSALRVPIAYIFMMFYCWCGLNIYVHWNTWIDFCRAIVAVLPEVRLQCIGVFSSMSCSVVNIHDSPVNMEVAVTGRLRLIIKSFHHIKQENKTKKNHSLSCQMCWMLENQVNQNHLLFAWQQNDDGHALVCLHIWMREGGGMPVCEMHIFSVSVSCIFRVLLEK